jgi:hypothetical protein
VFAFLAILFFLSGASALVYQVLCLRLLGLVFGVTVRVASTVWGRRSWLDLRSAASWLAPRAIASARWRGLA